jgi:transposase-like protein
VLLAVRNMGGESEAAWRGLLDDLVSRGLQVPSFVIIDGAAGLEKAVGLVWPEALVQRCTVHKHRNLLAHAPERLHEEISTDYNVSAQLTAHSKFRRDGAGMVSTMNEVDTIDERSLKPIETGSCRRVAERPAPL